MKNAIFSIVTEEESKLPFLLKSIGLRADQEYMARPAGFPDYHWLHCVRGRGRLILDNKEYTVVKSTGFFMCPDIPHEYYATERPWETHWITFNGHAAGSVVDIMNLRPAGVYPNLDISCLDLLMDEIYARANVFTPYRGLECSHLVYQFLIKLKYCIDMSPATQKKSPAGLQPVILYIEKNYNRSPSLDEMAEEIHVTPRHLCRLFRRLLNMSPFDYLTEYRIKKAKEAIIASGNLSVKEIAAQAGYNDTSYFCSLFKKHEGLTPTEFKKMHRASV